MDIRLDISILGIEINKLETHIPTRRALVEDFKLTIQDAIMNHDFWGTIKEIVIEEEVLEDRDYIR